MAPLDPPPPQTDWAKVSDGPSANQIFLRPITLDQKFSSTLLAPLKTQHHLDPPPPLKGALGPAPPPRPPPVCITGTGPKQTRSPQAVTMHVKEVILDGFKSYAHRTVVENFDKAFNAITGLNGSGKSNILDAICFVLGISVLSQVRVTSLQELIYKQGQAGVTKASVTIVFNNQDKSEGQCPVGYEDIPEITITRQIVMGGKNKYMINGKLVQQKQVQDLFQSVQLNVNNPHFLIMQGRITKVQPSPQGRIWNGRTPQEEGAPPPPLDPPQTEVITVGEKTKFTIGKSDWAIFGAQTFASQNPPLPPP